MLVKRVKQVNRVRKVTQGHREPVVKLGPQGQQDNQDQEVPQETEGLRVLMDRMVLLVP